MFKLFQVDIRAAPSAIPAVSPEDKLWDSVWPRLFGTFELIHGCAVFTVFKPLVELKPDCEVVLDVGETLEGTTSGIMDGDTVVGYVEVLETPSTSIPFVVWVINPVDREVRGEVSVVGVEVAKGEIEMLEREDRGLEDGGGGRFISAAD